MEQYLHENISKYGVWESRSSMDVLQERKLMKDHIGDILWYMQLLKEFFYTGNQINHLLSTEPIMFWLDEYNYRPSIEDKHNPGSLLLWQDPESHIYYSDLLNLIPCELDITSTPFSDTTVITYEIELPPSGKKVGLIYWVMNTLQSHTSLIQSQIHRLVVKFHHRLREMCVLYLSMRKSLSHSKVYLMNSIIIKLRGGGTRSRSVYVEGRDTKGQILKRFNPDLIKSYL